MRLPKKISSPSSIQPVSTAQGKYLVFFKARDADALNAAFAEYAAKTLRRNSGKPSLRQQLAYFKEMVKNEARDTVKNRDKGAAER